MNRRHLLQGVGSLAVAGAMPLRAGAGTPRRQLDLAQRSDLLQALVKMRGATDDRLVISFVIGTRYAVPEHNAIPMLGILAATFSQYRRVDDDTWAARALEVAYFTDLQTGQLLETWENPVTGRVVEVPQVRMGPSDIIVTADGLRVPTPSGEAAGLELRHSFNPAVVVGDHVWVTEDIRVDSGTAGPGGRPFVYNEMSTYQASLDALSDPALATVPTQVQYHSLITYRPWMGFGDSPGHTIAHGAGARVERFEQLPKYYIELTRRHHPDVYRDPLSVLNS
ncbi:MAG: DUF1838 family protein [Chromatiales bacterium]|nr:DUF1838 family protein [Chromatiales bacterium]